MPAPLLATKFYIPPARANGVARLRLVAKLHACLDRPGSFALLSGPAGSGKTTLLSEFVSGIGRPVAWLSLDESDNDPARFWTYLIAACQSVQAGAGEAALALLRSPQPLPDDAIPAILINDLAGLDRDLVLVLDDFHNIHNPSIQAALSFLLGHLPYNLHLVLSTRTDPPWPLARFRARDQLVEIRAHDLRFTPAEAAEFLNRTMGLDLPAEAVTALERRTEGWIAGLQLAALSMQGRSDMAAFVKAFTGSHAYIVEYLVEEALQRQPADVQAFLLQTSILERLCAPLCEQVLLDDERRTIDDRSTSTVVRRPSSDILDYLERSNLFLLPLDDRREWFRYHHLFADLLRSRLRRALPEDRITGLHRRAAAWYEQNGLAVEAMNHALAARDFDAAARLVEQYAYPLMTRGELATCLQWMAALPEDVTRRRPLFLLSKAWALTFAGSFNQVEPLLQQVEALIQNESESPLGRELLGSASAMRAFFAMLGGEYPRALELAERADSLSPENSTGARSLLPYTLGAALRGQGQYEKAAEAFARDVQMGERFGELLIWATGITELVNTRRMQGRLLEAVEIGRRALQHLAERGASQFGSLAKVEVALCEVLREQNELDEARERVSGAIARMQAWDMPTDRLFAYLGLARILESQGDFYGARENLRIARQLRDASPVLLSLSRAVDMAEIRLLLATRDVAAAEGLLESLHTGASRVLILRQGELAMLARVRLAQGRLDEAADLLSRIASDPEIIERVNIWLEVTILQACVLYTQGDREAAVALMLKTLAFAEPEGFVRVFVDEGETLRLLLVDCRLSLEKPGHERLRDYIDLLLEAFPKQEIPGDQRRPIINSQSTIRNLVEPLTNRELEVLQLIAAGDSNRAIAEKLVITVSAVKKHTANIYGKLDVNSRTQAVARARQLGLLSDSR